MLRPRPRVFSGCFAAAASFIALVGCSDQHSGADSPGVTTSNINFLPTYPGAGKSGADKALIGGMLCDYVPYKGQKGATPVTDCFFTQGQTGPAATIEQVLECAQERDAIHLRLTFDPNFVDNSYGANAIGWTGRTKAKMPMAPKGGPVPMMMPPAGMAGPGAMPAPGPGAMPAPEPGGKAGHTWKDLVGSDHAELAATDSKGNKIIQFKLDYISAAADIASGYRTLGVTGGDGKMIFGDPGDVVQYVTSIDRNLNERGYAAYTVDSPATDANYTANAATPNWDYRVVYEVWIDIDAFGDNGFGGASIEFVHASPSKAADNTLTVEHGPCPCQREGGCNDSPPPTPCEPLGPDDYHCLDSGLPPPVSDAGNPCFDHPNDPNCAAPF
jgi:hypothetical protein